MARAPLRYWTCWAKHAFVRPWVAVPVARAPSGTQMPFLASGDHDGPRIPRFGIPFKFSLQDCDHDSRVWWTQFDWELFRLTELCRNVALLCILHAQNSSCESEI